MNKKKTGVQKKKIQKEYGVIFETKYNFLSFKKCIKSWQKHLIKNLKTFYKDYKNIIILMVLNMVWIISLLLSHYNIDNVLTKIYNFLFYSMGGISNNILIIIGGMLGKLLLVIFLLYIFNNKIDIPKIRIDIKKMHWLLLGLALSLSFGTFIMGDGLIINLNILVILIFFSFISVNSINIIGSLIKSLGFSKECSNNLFYGLAIGFLITIITTILGITLAVYIVSVILLIIFLITLFSRNSKIFLIIMLLLIIPNNVQAKTKSHYGYIDPIYNLTLDISAYDSKIEIGRNVGIWFLDLYNNKAIINVSENGDFIYQASTKLENSYGYDDKYVDSIDFMTIKGNINPISLTGHAYVEINYNKKWYKQVGNACLDYEGLYFIYDNVLFDDCEISYLKNSNEEEKAKFLMTCNFKEYATNTYYCIKGKEKSSESPIKEEKVSFYFVSDMNVVSYSKGEKAPKIPNDEIIVASDNDILDIDKNNIIMFTLLSLLTSFIGLILHIKKRYSYKDAYGNQVKIIVELPNIDIYRTKTKYEMSIQAIMVDKNENIKIRDDIISTCYVIPKSNEIYLNEENSKNKKKYSFALSDIVEETTMTFELHYEVNNHRYTQDIDLLFKPQPTIIFEKERVELLSGSKTTVKYQLMPINFIDKDVSIKLIDVPSSKEFNVELISKNNCHYYEITDISSKKSSNNTYSITVKASSSKEACYAKFNVAYKGEGVNLDPMGNALLYATVDEKGHIKTKRMAISYGVFDKINSNLEMVKPTNIKCSLKDKKHLTDILDFSYEKDDDFDFNDKEVYLFKLGKLYPRDIINAKLEISAKYNNKISKKTFDIEILPVGVDPDNYQNIKYFMEDSSYKLLKKSIDVLDDYIDNKDILYIQNYIFNRVEKDANRIVCDDYLNMIWNDEIDGKYLDILRNSISLEKGDLLEKINSTLKKDIGSCKDKTMQTKNKIHLVRQGLLLELFINNLSNSLVDAYLETKKQYEPSITNYLVTNYSHLEEKTRKNIEKKLKELER